MQISKISYEQLFPLPQPFANVRIGIEFAIAKGDIIEDAFSKAKTIAEENFNRMFPPSQPFQPTDHFTGEPAPKFSIAKANAKAEADREFEEFKKEIDTFAFVEGARKFLELSAFKHSVEAKKYISEKFKSS